MGERDNSYMRVQPKRVQLYIATAPVPQVQPDSIKLLARKHFHFVQHKLRNGLYSHNGRHLDAVIWSLGKPGADHKSCLHRQWGLRHSQEAHARCSRGRCSFRKWRRNNKILRQQALQQSSPHGQDGPVSAYHRRAVCRLRNKSERASRILDTSARCTYAAWQYQIIS